MTLQHSPGPFAYLTFEDDYIILDAEGNCIADLMRSPHHGDGHLFAAAPDMLRLLRLLASIRLEQANLGIGPQTWIKATRKLLKELDGEA